jgi:hypothetical protein
MVAKMNETKTENSTRVGEYTIVKGKNNLYGANLEDQNLRLLDLCGSDMRFANLRNADLIGADLEGVDLEGAHLLGANFFLANVTLPVGWYLVGWIAYRVPGSDSFVRAKRNKYADRRDPVNETERSRLEHEISKILYQQRTENLPAEDGEVGLFDEQEEQDV